MSTPTGYNKHELNEELESFYRLIKLNANFKDNKNNKLTMKKTNI